MDEIKEETKLGEYLSNKVDNNEKKLPNVKLCESCEKVKDLHGEFYKAGRSYQKYCKGCHNKNRTKYPNNTKQKEKKKTGFLKLDPDIQEKIKYDLYVKINSKKISEKYGLNYITFVRWKKCGKIPPYAPKEL